MLRRDPIKLTRNSNGLKGFALLSCGAGLSEIKCVDTQLDALLLQKIKEERTMNESAEDTRTYKVVVNHEEQYSIWIVEKPNPRGWKDVGKSGSKQECLAYIKEVWTDMRPLSLRIKMDGKQPVKAPA